MGGAGGGVAGAGAGTGAGKAQPAGAAAGGGAAAVGPGRGGAVSWACGRLRYEGQVDVAPLRVDGDHPDDHLDAHLDDVLHALDALAGEELRNADQAR